MAQKQKSFMEIGLDIEKMRALLKLGMCTEAEAMSMMCIIFYFDMFVLMERKNIKNFGTIKNLIENYRTCAAVFGEYSSASEENKHELGRVMAFALIHSVSQIVETTEYIYKLIGLDSKSRFKEVKKSDYWKFRNWHTHAEPYKAKNFGKNYVVPNTKIFILERTGAFGIAYVTALEGGWSGSSVNFKNILKDMAWDFKKLFNEILREAEKLDDR